MTMFKPTLMVKRLVVFGGAKVVYDCTFRAGVNILWGQNGSGKSVIMDFIAFSLGAENIAWKPEALRCSETILEVLINGSSVCLRREISTERFRPISFYWGPLDDAIAAGAHLWEIHPFKRSETKLSFSQVMFHAMDVSEAQGVGASNITMHQVLRVLYADQLSIQSPIFRPESFDQALTREVVGWYLAGIYDDQAYAAQIRVRDLNSEIDERISEIKAIFHVLGRSGNALPSDFGATIHKAEESREELTAFVLAIKRGDFARTRMHEGAESLRKKLVAARKFEHDRKNELEDISLAIADSELFVAELDNRLRRLEESKETHLFFKEVKFSRCPACLTDLQELNDGDSRCALCLSTLEGRFGSAGYLRMRNELEIQANESASLILERKARVLVLRREINDTASAIRGLELEYATATDGWSTEREAELEAAARKLGAIEAEIRQLQSQQKLSEVIAELQTARDNLAAEKADLEDRLKALLAAQETRKHEVATEIGNALRRLLKQDLQRQPEFAAPNSALLSFSENAVYIDGVRNFAASSTVVLRHLVHIALLSASVRDDKMRLPRLMLLDGVDDGGMETERSHKLQEIIVEECSSYNADFQVIFATKSISPQLKNKGLVAAGHYTKENRTLVF